MLLHQQLVDIHHDGRLKPYTGSRKSQEGVRGKDCAKKSRLSGILPLPQIPKSGLVLCWGHVQAHKDGSIIKCHKVPGQLKLDVN